MFQIKYLSELQFLLCFIWHFVNSIETETGQETGMFTSGCSLFARFSVSTVGLESSEQTTTGCKQPHFWSDFRIYSIIVQLLFFTRVLQLEKLFKPIATFIITSVGIPRFWSVYYLFFNLICYKHPTKAYFKNQPLEKKTQSIIMKSSRWNMRKQRKCVPDIGAHCS